MERRHHRKKRKQIKIQPHLLKIVLGLILAVLIFVVVLLPKKAGENEGTTQTTTMSQTMTSTPALPELLIDSVEEQGGRVIVSTSYFDFSYPLAYADLIYMEAKMQDGQALLEFTTNIDGQTYRLYTLIFGGDGDIPLGTLRIGDSRYHVAAVIYEIDGAITEGWVNTFYAAQERFNDVVDSLEKNDGFIPAG